MKTFIHSVVPSKTIPDSRPNGQSVSFSDQNGTETLPDGAAHTCMAYIRKYTPPGLRATCATSSQDKMMQMMWRKTTVVSVLWIWHAEQSSLKFDWVNYNIRPISITLFPWTFRFIFFGSVVMENKRLSSRARYIKAEGLWGREFLKAWPSRFYSANNSFHYKDLNCPRDGFQYSIQLALSTAVQRWRMCKDTRYMLPIPRKIEAPCSVESVESTEYATGL